LLPQGIQALADKNFALLKADPSHPSLQFKLLAGRRLHSVRVGLHDSQEGERPMAIRWRLEREIPAAWLPVMALAV
jgi:hypothetical protein